jgi:hypothetical protein
VDNVFYLNKEYTRDMSINDIVKIKMSEIIKEALFTVKNYNSYEMTYAKSHLEDSLKLVLEAIDLEGDNL